MDRRDEIKQIISEEYDRMFAETDRHGHLTGSWPAACMCGWTAPVTSKNQRVSVGVHVNMAKRKAEKTRKTEADRRLAETRQVTR